LLAVGSGGKTSPASAVATDDASKRCPDLIVESITLPSSPGYPAGTVLGSTPDQPRSYTFGAVIKNQGEGTDATKTFLNRMWINDVVLGDPRSPDFDQPISGGLAANTTKPVTSGSWTADTVTTATTKTIKVCADQPPLPPTFGTIQEAPPTGIPATGSNPAEDNNCLISPFAFTILPPLSVQLEASKASTNIYRNDYVVVDYKDLAKLRWIVGGNPTTCAGVAGTDLTDAVTPQSYDVSGNPFSLTNLLNKISFKYQLKCSR